MMDNYETEHYVIIRGEKYDVSSFMHQHPNGLKIFKQYLGTDCTEVFLKQHMVECLSLIKHLIVPNVTCANMLTSDYMLNQENSTCIHSPESREPKQKENCYSNVNLESTIHRHKNSSNEYINGNIDNADIQTMTDLADPMYLNESSEQFAQSVENIIAEDLCCKLRNSYTSQIKSLWGMVQFVHQNRIIINSRVHNTWINLLSGLDNFD